jgi:hypothetical protein
MQSVAVAVLEQILILVEVVDQVVVVEGMEISAAQVEQEQLGREITVVGDLMLKRPLEEAVVLVLELLVLQLEVMEVMFVLER